MDNRRELEALDPSSNNATYTRVDALTPHKIAIVILIQQYLKVTTGVGIQHNSPGNT